MYKQGTVVEMIDSGKVGIVNGYGFFEDEHGPGGKPVHMCLWVVCDGMLQFWHPLKVKVLGTPLTFKQENAQDGTPVSDER